MQIHLRRLDNRTHRLEIVRTDGSREQRNLETRSLLLHDLVHYAVESEAGLSDGFWGTLAAGATMASLHPNLDEQGQFITTPSLALAEALVGPMQAVHNGRFSADAYVAQLRPRAAFVDRDFVDAVRERLRRLWGQWRGTPFHQTMTLSWPPKP
ncbi:MAG: hypothetical protein AAFV53_03840 [Myxococcota bacterium]